MKKVLVRTSFRTEMVDITHDVKKYVDDMAIIHGTVTIYVPHTTAGVTINEGADTAVQQDIVTFLNKLIPQNSGFSHAEGNSDAHLKASLIGPSITVIVNEGQLVLGTWQHIFFFEADGPRSRHFFITHVSK